MLVETAIQIYAERLMKIVNNRHQIINKNKLKLGEILNNQKIETMLKDKYNISEEQITNLKIINNHSNDHKHEDRSEFITKDIKKLYKQVIYITVKIYNNVFKEYIIRKRCFI